MKEADLLRFTCAALDYSGLVWFRVPVGGVAQSIGGGKIIYKKSPLKGFPDLAIITKQGVLSVLELKAKTKPTVEQKAWLEKLSKTNCNTCVAHTTKEVLSYIEQIGGIISPSNLIILQVD